MGNGLLLTIERLPEQRATAVGCRLHAVRVVISHDDARYVERLGMFFDQHCDCGRSDAPVDVDVDVAPRQPKVTGAAVPGGRRAVGT